MITNEDYVLAVPRPDRISSHSVPSLSRRASPGAASNGDEWHYQQRIEFSGTTTDGRAPRPNRSLPDVFLQAIPRNVTTATLDLSDFFILQPRGGDIVASSHVHFVLRQQIPPVETDPPPDYFPYVFFGKYIVDLHDQLAGELGCDPL